MCRTDGEGKRITVAPVLVLSIRADDATPFPMPNPERHAPLVRRSHVRGHKPGDVRHIRQRPPASLVTQQGTGGDEDQVFTLCASSPHGTFAHISHTSWSLYKVLVVVGMRYRSLRLSYDLSVLVIDLTLK